MRRTPNNRSDRHRMRHSVLGNSLPGENVGYFEVPTQNGLLRIIASDGETPFEEGWEHVSVTMDARYPTWGEMQQVKEIFWGADETVLQFHPSCSDYVNHRSFCLHLWRQREKSQKLPPQQLID